MVCVKLSVQVRNFFFNCIVTINLHFDLYRSWEQEGLLLSWPVSLLGSEKSPQTMLVPVGKQKDVVPAPQLLLPH